MAINYFAVLFQENVKPCYPRKGTFYQLEVSQSGLDCSASAWLERLTGSEIASLYGLISMYDRQTSEHAFRTLTLIESLVWQMECCQEEVELICLAALLHDIGKVVIPSLILAKSGSLDETEWKIMRLHPEIGREILVRAGGIFAAVGHIVVAHHERWDGMGYPAGLAGEDIPLLARILAIADSFDAMTTSRVYQHRRSTMDARHELLNGAGHQYDPHMVAVFVSLLDQWYERLLSIPPGADKL